MIRQFKYIIASIFQTIKYDFKTTYDNMAKPKELLTILFWLAIIEALTRRWIFFWITIGLYITVYIWKIIKQGDWRRRMRDDYIRT